MPLLYVFSLRIGQISEEG